MQAGLDLWVSVLLCHPILTPVISYLMSLIVPATHTPAMWSTGTSREHLITWNPTPLLRRTPISQTSCAHRRSLPRYG